MHYQTFLDHIDFHGCKLLPKHSTATTQVFRNIYNGCFATANPGYWISAMHVIGFCRDMDIEIPAELEHRIAEYDNLGF